jgi:hypothetical protein
MGRIDLTGEIPVAAGAVRAVLPEVLGELAQRSRDGDLSMAVRLGVPGGAPLADVSVPVLLTVAPKLDADGKIALDVKARAGGPFPAFSGTLGVSERAPATTGLSLQGVYEVPLGPIGAALDAGAFHGVAERSLAVLLEKIAAAAHERLGQQAERERRQTRGM